MLPFDLHTHSVASGHGTTNTITDMAKKAAERGMLALGISDHGPKTPGACGESYFRSLPLAPRHRQGIDMYYGIEANIVDTEGRLDISDAVLAKLDYVIASIHTQSFHAPSAADYTQPYINAMKNPYVKIIGHPDDAHFPIDTERLVQAASYYHVILEVNEASLAPDGYRGDARAIMFQLLTLCREYGHPILISSDSHGKEGIGNAPYAMELITAAGYPMEGILNFKPVEAFLQYRNQNT